MMNFIAPPLDSGSTKRIQSQPFKSMFTAVSIGLLLGAAFSFLWPGLSGLALPAAWALAFSIGMLAVGSFQPGRDDGADRTYPFMVIGGQLAGLIAMSLLLLDIIS